MNLTEFANTAVEEISKAQTFAMNVFADARRTDSGFPEDDNPNALYNEHAEQYHNKNALCHMVDAYQWYNSQIFALLATHDSAAFEQFADNVSLNARDIRRIATGVNAIGIIAGRARMRDRTVREHLHRTLGLWEESEVGVLVDIRNCCIHHLGLDFEDRVQNFLNSGKRTWGLRDQISLVDRRIVFFDGAYLIGAQIFLPQISIFDQMVANRFGLPTLEHTQFSLPRSWRG